MSGSSAESTHGEVRILFELYGCVQGYWQLVDQWEPEMIVLHGAIHENFTYTVFGQQPNEQRRAFRQRLEKLVSAKPQASISSNLTVAQEAMASVYARCRPPKDK